MYKEFREFTTPPDDTVIWRYMSLWKFEDLLNTSKLYMASIEKMGDEKEGIIAPDITKKLKEAYEGVGEPEFAKAFDLIANNPRFRKETCISSWNMGERESYALWKIYTSDKTSIAIQTTVGKLKASLSEEEGHIYIGSVNYHDGVNYTFTGNLFSICQNKYDYYEFEKELRMVTINKTESLLTLPDHPDFKRINIDPDILIDKVWLAPNADSDHTNHIQDLLVANGLDKEIRVSGIRDKWLHKEED